MPAIIKPAPFLTRPIAYVRPVAIQPAYGAALKPFAMARWVAVSVVGPKPIKVDGRVPIGTQMVVGVVPIGGGSASPVVVHAILKSYASSNGRNWGIMQILPGYLIDPGPSFSPSGGPVPQPGDIVLID